MTFCDLIPLNASTRYKQVSWNYPFRTTVEFGTEKVEEFISGIPFRRIDGPAISIYYPSHAKFGAYDVIIAVWGEDGERQLYGYQLKEGKAIPKDFFWDKVFVRSYLIRGAAATKDASINKLWTTPSDPTLDHFFGESAKNWSPKCWAALKNNSTLAATTEASRNGVSSATIS